MDRGVRQGPQLCREAGVWPSTEASAQRRAGTNAPITLASLLIKVRRTEAEVPVGHRVPWFRLRATVDAGAPVFRPLCRGPRSFCFRVRRLSQSLDHPSQVASRGLCAAPEVSKQGRALPSVRPEPGLAAPNCTSSDTFLGSHLSPSHGLPCEVQHLTSHSPAPTSTSRASELTVLNFETPSPLPP